MAFGNFWRGGGRERFGSERDQGRNRDRWRTSGNDWRDINEQRYGSWDRDRNRDDYGRDYGGREGRYGSSDWESGDYYGDRYRGQNEGYGPQSGRGWGSEERESDYSGSRQGGGEYDYRGGSLYGGGFGRGSGGSYGTAGSYGEDYRSGSHYQSRGTNRGRGPRNYRRSDERIREDVCERLTQDEQIDASSIEVMVTDGEVTLTGMIFERGDKRRAEDLAEDVSGVKDVRNNLRVSTERSGQQSGQQRSGTQSASGQSTATQGQQQTQQGQQSQQGQTGQNPRH